MIWEATYADLGPLVEMGHAFFGASGYEDLTVFDPESFAETCAMLIESMDGILLVTEGGMVGGMVYPYYFNHSHKTAQELFWWVDEPGKGVGRALLDVFEEKAREKGAKTITMIALDHLEPDRVGMIYERRGYRPSEHSYIRSL